MRREVGPRGAVTSLNNATVCELTQSGAKSTFGGLFGVAPPEMGRAEALRPRAVGHLRPDRCLSSIPPPTTTGPWFVTRS
nr:putative P8 protein [Apple luteovirus 1]